VDVYTQGKNECGERVKGTGKSVDTVENNECTRDDCRYNQ